LHILDLVQNSIEAGAGRVLLEIVEDEAKDLLLIRVTDDGKGMDEETRQKVTDPFVTSRTTRRIGLGLPLIDMSTKQCDGYLKIKSELGKGTIIEAAYCYSHIDRPPLGNMVDTIKTLVIVNPKLDFNYCHFVNGRVFILSTREISTILGEMPFTHPDFIIWLDAFLADNFDNLYGGRESE